ncbi:7973_t:CDS:1, partial [Scutellospora calospora]
NVKNNSQLLAGLENFKKGYEKAKFLSNGKLASYLYQRNSTTQAELIRSGAKIWVQPASIQQRKRKISQKNINPTIIGARKKRRTSKKVHNLSRNITENKQN